MKRVDSFSRSVGQKSKSARRSSVRDLRRACFDFEPLERRELLTVSGDFVTLQGDLQGFLNKVDGAVDTVVEVSKAKLPIIDKSLGELTGADTAISDFQQAVESALTQISNYSDPNSLEQHAEDVLNEYLGSGPQGIGILKGQAQVELPQDADDDLIKVTLDLGKKLASPDFTLGFGLSGIPFATVEAQGTFNFDVGFEVPSLVFGLDAAGHLFVDPFQLQLSANANLVNPELDAELGFLHVHVTKNPEKPDGNHLSAAFGIGVDTSDLENPSLSSPVLNGSADVDLMLSGGFTGAEIAAPNVEANFVLHWDFVNSQAQHTDSTFGSNLSADFKNVRVNLGTYLTNMVGPAVQKIQQFTEPFKDFFELLDEPIPVISDIAKVVGDNDGVSLLDVATILQNTGVIPPDYSALVTLSKNIIQITNVINAIETEKANELADAFIDLGDFDLIGNQGNPSNPDYEDIRDVAPASQSGFGKDVTKINWSSLEDIAANIDLSYIKSQINQVVGDDLGNALGDALDKLKNPGSPTGNFAKIDLSFPITEHPADAIFGLLIGQDTDLVSFTADAKLVAAGDYAVFNYQGFQISLFGGLKLDAHLKLAYDTYGLRHMVYDFFSPPPGGVTGEMIGLDLLDGLYLDPTTHLDLDVTVGIKGGVNYELLQAFVSGHLDAGVHVFIPQGIDTDGNGVRPSEFTDDLFHINGALSGGLDFSIKVGVDPLSWSEKVTLADGEIASFNIGGVNPFEPTEDVALAMLINGQLTLNMGSLGHRLARNYKMDQTNEKFIITHSDPQSGDAPGEAVNVSFGGLTQRFTGVTAIFAEGADGNDTVEIDEDVLASVNLSGGLGADVLTSKGSGVAVLDGGDGNDKLTAGGGNHTLYGGLGDDALNAGTGDAEIHGGDGNDKILGGPGANALWGDAGDDLITGGTGPNSILGGAGKDHLIAGPQNGDILNGEGDDDFLEAGQGFATLIGGAGNDDFLWNYIDPTANILQSDGGLKIDGGAGDDQATFFGGPTNDVFSVNKIVGNPQYEVQVQAPFNGEGGGLFSFTSILMTQVEGIDVEGGDGADNVTVNELTNTRVTNVGVNLTDLVEDYYGIGDGVEDHVVINGTQAADNVTIKSQDVQIQEPAPGQKVGVIGGLTTVSGIPLYTVRTANVQDDVVFNARDGSDTINVKGITGPTLVHGNGNASPNGADDDVFNVSAFTTDDYVTELDIDADGGTNSIHVMETGTYADTFVVQQQRVESNLLHAVNFVATGGNFTGGVTVTAGQSSDVVNVRSTLPSVHTAIETGNSNDVVNVSSQAPNGGGLAPILGILSIDMGAGFDNTLRISDQAASGNQNVFVSANQVLGFAGPLDNTPIFYNSTGGALGLWLEGSDSPALSERFVVNNPSANLTLDARAGDDKVNVVAVGQAATLAGGQGNDMIIIGYGVNKLDGVQGALTVQAGDGSDLLGISDVAASASHTYAVTTNIVARSGAAQIWSDASVEILALSTTDLDDEVLIGSIPQAKQTNINTRSGNDRITGPDAGADWLVTDNDAGSIGGKLRFVGTENLRGGSGGDRFSFADGKGLSGMVQGAGGTDVLDYSAYTTPVIFNLKTKIATNVSGGWDQVETFVGGVAADQIVGPDLPNIWAVTGANSGQANTMAIGVLGFSGVENLYGGASSDVFQFIPSGRIGGTINGQAGTDTLDFAALPASAVVSVNLLLGTATNVDGGIAGIENAAGGAGNDILVGNSQANQLSGNGGRDLLIGGLGADILNGGADDDILIAGTTDFDSQESGGAFGAVMREWSVQRLPYSTRRLHLLGALSGGLNGGYQLTNITVNPDLDNDQLTGGSGTDWFWANPNEILDLNAALGEKVGAS
jgi:Ca2+-binding RTX toxin-like protein